MANEPPIHVTPEGPHPHPPHVGQRWLDLAIALSAIFISLVSLFVAIEHGRTERELVAANSWPFLRAILSNERADDPEKDVAIGVSNGGVGPAKVRSFEVFYRGEPMRSGADLPRRCCALSINPAQATAELKGSFRYSIVDDTVLRPGEDNVVLELKQTTGNPIAARFSNEVRFVTFSACYCSVFDECWKTNLRTTDVHPVKACAASEHPFDPNGR